MVPGGGGRLSDLPEASPPDEFDEYTIVILAKPPDAPALSGQELELNQRQHLGHFASLKERGLLLACGPVDETPDPAWRGVCIYKVGLDEARRLAESDPAVRRGRFKVLAYSWVTGKGSLEQQTR